MLRCVILDDYQGAALELADWSALADRVEVTALRAHLEGEDTLVEVLRDVEIVVIMRERTPITASLLARLPRLRLLVTTGMRNASIDLRAAAEQSVVVCGTRSSSTPPAELTWALILALARHVATESAAMRAGGPWQSTIGEDLEGRTLGLLGFGRIGIRVARVGLAFGMDVVAWSENLTAERTQPEGVRLASSRDELLAGSDVVSIHLVLSPRTTGLVDAAALALMRPTALLVNTSRAAIVDGPALAAALEARTIGGAGLDVFQNEPLPHDDPLRRNPNVLATPHLGYVTRANYQTYFDDAIEDIAAFLDGVPMRTLASPPGSAQATTKESR